MSSAIAIIQLALVLLASVQRSSITISDALREQAITVANQAIQIAQQALAREGSSSVAMSDADVDRVKTVLQDIRQGYLAGDLSMVLKHATAKTVVIFSAGAKLEAVRSYTVNKVFRSGPSIVADVTIVSQTGASETNSMVFLKEGADWKFDLEAGLQYAEAQAAQKGTGDPSGLPDLVVSGVAVYPSYPIVNSKDIQITATIKNIGTKTSASGASVVAALGGFSAGVPVQGGVYYPIAPGETVTWSFRPYDKNDFFKISDIPGKKTIQITLNKNRETVESSYANNVFTQDIQMNASGTPSSTLTAAPRLTVTAPAGLSGGQDVLVGTTLSVTWNASGVNKVNLSLCTLSGSCHPLGGASQGIDASAGKYSWHVDANDSYFPGDNLRIKIQDADSPTITFGYSGYFSVYPQSSQPPSITVLSPAGAAGGQDITLGSGITVTWNASGVNKVNLSLCTLSGSCHPLGGASQGISGSSFPWYVDSADPFFPGDNFRIKVADSSNGSVYGYSGYFSVRYP